MTIKGWEITTIEQLTISEGVFTHIPPRLRSDIRKLSGQNAFDDTICAPSFMLANLIFSCTHNADI